MVSIDANKLAIEVLRRNVGNKYKISGDTYPLFDTYGSYFYARFEYDIREVFVGFDRTSLRMKNDRSRTQDGFGADDVDAAAEVRLHPSVAIVERIADETGISPLELPPLNDTIDADALDQLLGIDDGATSRTWPIVVFTYANHRVRVMADGRIVLTSPDATDISAVDEWAHVSIVNSSDDRDLAARTVSAIAERSRQTPAEVRSAAADVVDLEAVSRLGCQRGNGESRPGGTVLFSVLGYDVVVESTGTVAIGSTLKRLKQTGGNVLVTGAVPDELTDVASANLLGDPERGRQHLFALLDRDATTVSDRLGSPNPAAARVVEYASLSRSAASSHPSADSDDGVADEPTDLAEFETAVKANIEALAASGVVCEPGELRLCVDSLRPVLEERDADGAAAFLEPICNSVRNASGLAHYVVPIDREEPAVRALESLFDATIELRVGTAGPQQRWHLHESEYTTDWFVLRALE